jgi:hypothetical protein
MVPLDPDLFGELASLVELDDGHFGTFIEETGDLDDGRIILGSSERDHAFGGFYPGRLRALADLGLIEDGRVMQLTPKGRAVVRAAGGPDAPTPARSDVLKALEHVDLHHMIEPRVRRAFEHDDPQQAVAEAFAALEVHLRQALVASGHAPRKSGLHHLAAQAFAQEGPLSDLSQDPGERDGIKYLFFGAAGAVRNRNAHDRPTYNTDEALRLVLFADHLLRQIDTAHEALARAAETGDLR